MATMRDVADLAQVSVATVSYIVNGTKNVKASTRDRVEAAMRELGFTRHPIGTALAGGRTRILAMLYPVLERPLSPTSSAFFTSAARRARERGYDLVLWPIGNDAEQIEVLARAGLVDGVLLMEVQLEDPRVGALASREVPFAMIGRTADPSGFPYVDIDMAVSTERAYEHLREHGHHEIAFLYSAKPSYSHGAVSRAREAYLALSARAGREPRLVVCDEDPREGRALGERFQAEHPRATAVISINEHAAPGLITGLGHAGARVPDDISVVSLGSSAYMAELTDPPLTYLRTLGSRLGELGLDALLDRVEKPDEPLPQVLLPCELVTGETVARLNPTRP